MWIKDLWKAKLEVFTLRAIGFWLDLLVLTPVCGAVAWGLNRFIDNPGLLSGQDLDVAWWTSLVIFIYRLIFEATRHTSLGKLFAGVTVTSSGNAWISATLRNSWLLITAGIGLAGTLGWAGDNLTGVEILLPVLLGVCVLIWSKTPFDILAAARVEKSSALAWQDWLKRNR